MRRIFLIAQLAAALNVLVLAFTGSYDVRLGPLHLAAHGLFKPLLYLNAALLLACLAAPDQKQGQPGKIWSPNGFWIALAVCLLYIPSFGVSATHAEWTHQLNSAAHDSFSGLAHLFVSKQADGFYRPFVFLLLWVDYRIFGDHQWGYHIQNLFFHTANCLLLVRLGVRLGMTRDASHWAAFLFGLASVNYEPVIWPGARFDLVAAFFTLLALLAALVWWRERRPSALWVMGLCFGLGVLSKESAYCFPVLLFFLIATAHVWGLPRLLLPDAAKALGIAAAISVLFLAIRWSIYRGMGGYPDATGVAPHFAIHMATFTSFFTRALPVPAFALNTEDVLLWWARGAVAIFAVAACGLAVQAGGVFSRKLGLLAGALISALPAVNLVDWISPLMRNTRYLYLPAMWICLLIAVAGVDRPRARWWLLGIVFANAVAAFYNFHVFHWFDWAPRPSAL